MRFRNIHINGYGVFHGESIQDLPAGLIVVHGPNESGKSTLLGFLRAMLFGQKGRDVPNKYEPLRGGAHSGQCLLVTTDGREYSVQRDFSKKQDVCKVFDLKSNREMDSIEPIIGQITREVYHNVYAFGLSELSALENLQGDALRNAIYGAGQGAAFKALPDAVADIQKELEDIFTPRGRTGPLINRMQNRFSEVSARLRQAEQGQNKYEKLQSHLHEVEWQLKKTREAIQKNEQARHERENLEKLWSTWEDWLNLDRLLAEMDPALARFPAENAPELDRLHASLEHAREDQANTEQDLQDQRLRVVEITVDRNLLECTADLDRLNTEAPRFQQLLEQIPANELRVQDRRRRVQSLLEQLGPEWSVERVENLDRSLFTSRTIETHSEKFKEIALEKENAKRNAREKAEAEDDSRREVEALEQQRQSRATSPEAGREALQALQGLRRALETIQEKEKRIVHLRERAADRDQQIQGVTLSEKPSSLPQWFGGIVAAGGLGGMAAGAWMLFLREVQRFDLPVILALSLGLPFFVAGIAALTVGLLRRRQFEVQRRECRTKRFPLQQEMDSLIKEADNLAAMVEEKRADLRAAMEKRGLQKDARPEDLERVIEQQRESISELELLDRDIAKARQILENSAAAREKADAALETIRRREQTLQQQWNGWLKESGLPENASPEIAREALQIVHEICDFMQEMHTLEKANAEGEGWTQDFLRRVNGVFRQLEQETPEPAAVTSRLKNLMEENTQARERATRLDEKMTRLRDLENRLAKATGHLERVEENLRALLQASGVDDVPAFRSMLQRHQAWKEARQRQMNVENSLLSQTGLKDMQALRDCLEETSLLALEHDQKDLTQKIEALRNEEERLHKERATTQQHLERLSDEDDIARLRLEQEGLLESIRDQAHIWRRDAIALLLLEQARKKFEEEKQPSVLKHANRIFQAITQNRYNRLTAPIGEDSFSVHTSDGARREPAMLSRGTAEQLYLALRFGFIRQRAEQLEPLPVIMDDILVNFDPARSRETARALAALAESHQIFFFSCHRPMVDLLRQENPAAPVFGLESGAIRPM